MLDMPGIVTFRASHLELQRPCAIHVQSGYVHSRDTPIQGHGIAHHFRRLEAAKAGPYLLRMRAVIQPGAEQRIGSTALLLATNMSPSVR